MARPPRAFVRELAPQEGARLRALSRRHRQFSIRQRAQILLASSTGMAVPLIAQALQIDDNQVRRVIGEFNAEGMESLRPRIGVGSPQTIDEAARAQVVDIALARPPDPGEPGTRWSLHRLRRCRVIQAKVIETVAVVRGVETDRRWDRLMAKMDASVVLRLLKDIRRRYVPTRPSERRLTRIEATSRDSPSA